MFASCVFWLFEAGNLYIVYRNTVIQFLSLATDPLSMLRDMNTVYPLATFRDINAFLALLLVILEIPGSDLGQETCHSEGGFLVDLLTPSV